jgi:ABC-type nitrate/sulfonate/bicarbonate transport system substrate-binding protein
MNRRLAAIAILALIAVAGYGIWWDVTPHPAAMPGPPGSITVGLEPNQANSLIYVADEKGYFAENGLTITLREYPSGAAAVDGMIAGEADVAMATEWVLAGQALTQEHVRTFACIDKFEQVFIIGRNDRGIRNASDLKGTTIGLPLKASPEFYLGRYLDLHGMKVADVTLVDVEAPQLSDALANGTVDAVVAWQPYATRTTDRVTTGLAVWPAESGQAAYCAAVTTDAWLSLHREPSRRFLAALARAETDAARDPAGAKAIVGKRLDYDRAYLDAVWPEHRFSLSLDQSLVAAMEDEARWKIANNLTNATAIPDFGEYMDTTALEQVRPESVRLIAGTTGS